VNDVKIDSVFISAIESSDADRTIVSSVIDLAHRLGKQVTAEGVETSRQASILREFGCDHIQGYLIARPVTASQAEAFLTQGR